MKTQTASLAVALLLSHADATAQTPEPGPHYFVSDTIGSSQQFTSGKTTTFGGVTIIENFNLLATVLGDAPEAPHGAKLVDKEQFSIGTKTLTVQPFAFTTAQDPKKRGIDITAGAPSLKKFLQAPLGSGTKFDLTLPFKDPRVALSDNSAALRPSADNGCWHTAIDFDVSGSSTSPFDVVAPADGVVEGNLASPTLVIRHVAANRKEFLTVYSHIVPATKSHLKKGRPVRRGELLGRVDEGGKYAHLHFAVAVQGPARNVRGTGMVPELWYVIDPFGVYDYRRNKDNPATHNYLPNNTLQPEVRGVHMAYAFRTNPVTGSLPPP